jgi:hypothetical protein
MSGRLRYFEVEIGHRADFDIYGLEKGVSCSCGCIICSFSNSVSTS